MTQSPIMADFSSITYAQELDAEICDAACNVENIVRDFEAAGHDVEIAKTRWFHRNDRASVHTATREITITVWMDDGDDQILKVRQVRRISHANAHKIKMLEGHSTVLA